MEHWYLTHLRLMHDLVFFMELVRFEPGADLTLLEMTEGAASYNLKQAKAPDGHEPFKGDYPGLQVRDNRPSEGAIYINYLKS